jgi:hypothetical protein
MMTSVKPIFDFPYYQLENIPPYQMLYNKEKWCLGKNFNGRIYF